MAELDAEGIFREFEVNAAADTAMSLLRSPDALIHLALMSAHLGDGQSVEGQTLAAHLDRDLAGLATHNPYAATRDAEKILRHWKKQRWVHRRLDTARGVERYQLTSGAAQAVRQMRGLRRHTSVATESALSMVMNEMSQIASDANPDPQARMTALTQQIDDLNLQLEELRSGRPVEVDSSALADRVMALVHLAERIPADLARYGELIYDNTAALMQQSISGGASQYAESLQRMFDGHDVIAESPEGQAFRAFATLVASPTQRTRLEGDIDDVVAHVDGLPEHVRDTLTGFIDSMWSCVQDVEERRATAFRRISTFVHSGDVRHYQSMTVRLKEASAAAKDAFNRAHPGRDIGFHVPARGVDAATVGRLRVSEGPPERPAPVTDSTDEFAIDPAALAAREAIDWEGLREAIHAAMRRHGGYATLPEVLEQLPTARVGDIVGVWSLAARHGDIDDGDTTTVAAHTGRGLRSLTLPYMVFAEPIPEPEGSRPGHAISRPQLTLMESLDHD